MPITLDKFINILNVSIKNQLKTVEIKGVLSFEVKESLNLLFKEGFIRGFSTEGHSTLIDFRFEDTGKNIISNLTFLKKSSFQNNISIANLWKREKGNGIFVLSTSKGILTDNDARFLNVGGYLLFSIV